MIPEQLLLPVSDEEPTGVEAVYTTAFQELVALADYIGARLQQSELDRLAKVDYAGENAESDRRTAQANAEDARRSLERAEASVKELTGRGASPEGARNDMAARARKMLEDSSKDLRIVQHLALAWAGQNGLAGYADALRLSDELMQRFGDALHPRPDEDDPTDVSAREMVVTELLNGEAFLQAMRDCVVLESPAVGRYTGRDAEVIDGRMEDDQAGGPRSPQQIAAIAQAQAPALSFDSGDNLLRDRISAVDECLDAARSVMGRFSAGAILGDRVFQLLERIRAQLSAALQPDAADFAPGAAVAGPAGAGAALSVNGLRSREDARRLILEVSRYIEATEPSHPAPFFLKRAERLLGARDFFEILRDMAPDSISELERITGHRDNASETF